MAPLTPFTIHFSLLVIHSLLTLSKNGNIVLSTLEFRAQEIKLKGNLPIFDVTTVYNAFEALFTQQDSAVSRRGKNAELGDKFAQFIALRSAITHTFPTSAPTILAK